MGMRNCTLSFTNKNVQKMFPKNVNSFQGMSVHSYKIYSIYYNIMNA